MAIGVWFVLIAIGIINGKNEQVKYLGQDCFQTIKNIEDGIVFMFLNQLK